MKKEENWPVENYLRSLQYQIDELKKEVLELRIDVDHISESGFYKNK